jgi:hypothetical protein
VCGPERQRTTSWLLIKNLLIPDVVAGWRDESQPHESWAVLDSRTMLVEHRVGQDTRSIGTMFNVLNRGTRGASEVLKA